MDEKDLYDMYDLFQKLEDEDISKFRERDIEDATYYAMNVLRGKFEIEKSDNTRQMRLLMADLIKQEFINRISQLDEDHIGDIFIEDMNSFEGHFGDLFNELYYDHVADKIFKKREEKRDNMEDLEILSYGKSVISGNTVIEKTLKNKELRMRVAKALVTDIIDRVSSLDDKEFDNSLIMEVQELDKHFGDLFHDLYYNKIFVDTVKLRGKKGL